MPFMTSAQQQDNKSPNKVKALMGEMNEHGVFNTIEIAANIGTTGLGLEVASPMTEWTKLRVGFDWMPPFTIPMNFYLGSYVHEEFKEKFEKIQDMMYSMSGMMIKKKVVMDSKPTMATLRVLVDVYPFKANRHWHFTAGFFLGGNTMGTSLNTVRDMTSLMALKMYDRMYTAITADDFYDKATGDPDYLANATGISALKGTYLDPRVVMELQDKMNSLGRLGIHAGDYKDGTPYMMMPDEDGTVSAKANVNRFRPYLGFGYGGALTADGKWQVSLDAGAQFWGGVPKVITHDGTVLNDLINLQGEVGRYMGLMKAIPVYPTIDFRISYRF